MNGFNHDITAKLQRLEKVEKATKILLDVTESFEENNLGAASFYLLNAILFDAQVEIFEPVDQDDHIGPLFNLLKENCSPDQLWILDYFKFSS